MNVSVDMSISFLSSAKAGVSAPHFSYLFNDFIIGS